MDKTSVNRFSSRAAHELSSGGAFNACLAGFVPRQSQQEMALSVADTLTHGGKLIAESGTGTGKTFAYLVPILLSGNRTIVSTGTRHLQDQIFHRDLPTVSKILGKPVKAEMLKGRSNYLCRYRLRQNSGQSDLAGSGSKLSFSIIERWAVRTVSGDIAEVSEIPEQAPIWKEVTSTTDNCLGNKCPDFKKCFVTRARLNAMEADIVVVNHHLFFSDLTLKEDGFGELLPRYEAVVFDEAHTLGEIAATFFGFSVSSYQLQEICHDVTTAEAEYKSGANFAPVLVLLDGAVENLKHGLRDFEDQSVDFAAVDQPLFRQALEQLQIRLDALLGQLEIAAPAGEGLEKCYQRCLQIQDRLDLWIDGRDHNLIRWLSAGRRHFRLHGTPLRVSHRFSELLSRANAWIFTSATLAIGDDFSAFCGYLGLEQCEQKRWDSPYDFSTNTLLYLPTDMPDPRQREYADRLTEVILETINASRGRAFCLFTSYAMMNKVHKTIRSVCKWPLLLQGDSPRSELMDRFQRTENPVLFGTSSFWEGVDVKGESLSCVIIDKLPFASPGDPVLKSRLQACEEQGGNPFMDIQLPSAVIALKQGAGRLIRSETDKGVLVICDPRITTKRYGQIFLRSLPPLPVSRQIHDVQCFFKALSSGPTHQS